MEGLRSTSSTWGRATVNSLCTPLVCARACVVLPVIEGVPVCVWVCGCASMHAFIKRSLCESKDEEQRGVTLSWKRTERDRGREALMWLRGKLTCTVPLQDIPF